VQREDAVSDQFVVPLSGAVLVLGREMVCAGVDFRDDAGLLPPGVGRRDEGAISVEKLRVEHRPRQTRTQDQPTEIALGDRPDAVAHLGKRLA
jgi:hypothetical protein